MHSGLSTARPEVDAAARIFEVARSEGRQFVMEPEAKEILRAWGITVPQGFLCHTPEEALTAATKIGYPVVLKIVSPQIVHKSEAGGVRVGITGDEGLRQAYVDIVDATTRAAGPDAVRGMLVEEMAGGLEVIIGGVRDAQFGPLVVFGLGGIFVEVLKDVAYRLAPVVMAEATRMIKEIKGYPLLAGARGRRPADEQVLADILVKVSNLIAALPEVRELDLNPVLVDGSRVIAADARIIID